MDYGIFHADLLMSQVLALRPHIYTFLYDFTNSLKTILKRLLRESLVFLYGLFILISLSVFMQLYDIFMGDTILFNFFWEIALLFLKLLILFDDFDAAFEVAFFAWYHFLFNPLLLYQHFINVVCATSCKIYGVWSAPGASSSSPIQGHVAPDQEEEFHPMSRPAAPIAPDA